MNGKIQSLIKASAQSYKSNFGAHNLFNQPYIQTENNFVEPVSHPNADNSTLINGLMNRDGNELGSGQFPGIPRLGPKLEYI